MSAEKKCKTNYGVCVHIVNLRTTTRLLCAAILVSWLVNINSFFLHHHWCPIIKERNCSAVHISTWSFHVYQYHAGGWFLLIRRTSNTWMKTLSHWDATVRASIFRRSCNSAARKPLKFSFYVSCTIKPLLICAVLGLWVNVLCVYVWHQQSTYSKSPDSRRFCAHLSHHKRANFETAQRFSVHSVECLAICGAFLLPQQQYKKQLDLFLVISKSVYVLVRVRSNQGRCNP